MVRLALTFAVLAALLAAAAAPAPALEPSWRDSAVARAPAVAASQGGAAPGELPEGARERHDSRPPLARVAAPTERLAWTATVRRPVLATSRPGGGRGLARLGPRAPWWGGANVLLVRERPRRVGGVAYVRVLLKLMPAGTHGWVRADAVRLAPTARRIVIDRSDRTVALERDGRTLLRSRVVIGAPATPTPLGLFAVDAPVDQAPGGLLGPRVLALTAYSRTLTEYDGGIPQTAIHAFEQLGDPLGVAASNGCIRVPHDVVDRLIAGAPRGTPVLVRP